MSVRPPNPVLSSPQADGPSRRHPDGRDFYSAGWPPESRAEYDRIIVEWLSNGRRLPGPPRASGPISRQRAAFGLSRFADSYYVKHGRPTTERLAIRMSIRPLRQLYGETPARDFGPLQLKAVRQAMIESGLCRNEVNRRAG